MITCKICYNTFDSNIMNYFASSNLQNTTFNLKYIYVCNACMQKRAKINGLNQREILFQGDRYVRK